MVQSSGQAKADLNPGTSSAGNAHLPHRQYREPKQPAGELAPDTVHGAAGRESLPIELKQPSRKCEHSLARNSQKATLSKDKHTARKNTEMPKGALGSIDPIHSSGPQCPEVCCYRAIGGQACGHMRRRIIIGVEQGTMILTAYHMALCLTLKGPLDCFWVVCQPLPPFCEP